MKRRNFLKYLVGIYGLFSIDVLARDNKICKQYNFKPKLCLIGIGGGGTNIVDDLSRLGDSHAFIHLNSDYNSLKQKKSKNKILLGWTEKAGLGCGGKAECGRNLVNNDVKNKLEELTNNMGIVYIVSTLGGGVGSGATPEVIKYLKSLDKKVIVFVTTPFSFEGRVRYSIAYNAIEEIKKYSDKLIVLKNDDLLDISKNKFLGIKDTLKITSNSVFQMIKHNKNNLI